ncbi:MAG: Carbamoyl-phosphate synthase small chain [Alphaproteobacteria bacterium MarineAlpha11_Bin1]|nr:MAG: Carbamoyl-phosphate synthase small chain [Alphaproteobacteria bacterium MarineAlpha11_Bin1]|tara:strand:- start:151 stop:1365 length:1215 start_codon:yes stop_codon:yes gene_type:complete
MAKTATPTIDFPTIVPNGATGALVLADGSVIWGHGIGAIGVAVGEVCFNTSITGYQEILTDPSYAGQIISFTFPHIGNVGVNLEDFETTTPVARGLILRADITHPSNWRATQHLDAWLKRYNLIGITGVDTRRLTRLIREFGAPKGVICNASDGDNLGLEKFSGKLALPNLLETAKAWPGLEGMDLAKEVTCQQTYVWDETLWALNHGFGKQVATQRHVVAIDFGAKRNILRCLADAGCKVTVVPATASTEDVLRHSPDGVFLSNGPGDPMATGEYAVPVIRQLIKFGLPIFGICLGHQLLALSLGASTKKMHLGHRGANHPVKDLVTGRVEITSQNHGFVVDKATLPEGVKESHVSLFDGSLEGIRCTDGREVFSVQYHPEASPGPEDSHHLFGQFMEMIDNA